MKRHVLIYGVVGGVLIALLQWTEYRFLILEHSTTIYGGLIAAIFAGFGIWLGLRMKGAPPKDILREVSAAPTSIPASIPAAAIPDPNAAFVPNNEKRASLSITPRELEILTLVAKGLSNREIAGTLFVSENTVKTHCSRAFDKLGAKRRTQAVQLGKELGLIP